MSSSAASQISSVSHHLHAIKEILRDVTPEMKVVAAPDKAEVDALEQDTFDILRLIRSWKNMVAPIGKIPPEILALVPDFLDLQDRYRSVVVLTHVCRAWREVFISRSSLWTDFDCADGERTYVYLERSKSSPINLSLHRIHGSIPPYDPLFQIIPRAVGRLKSLFVKVTPDNLQAITPHLSHPAPLLEHLTMYGDREHTPRLVPSSTLFNGDLSSLHTLRLDSIRTELPWRNMVNLTSFTLGHTPLGEVPVGQLLDFFEGAPHLCEVNLIFANSTAGAQYGRLVSLVCLKNMYIEGSDPSSVLLGHLVIPVGARLTTRVDLRSSLIWDHLPRSLDNLKNLSDFTTIQLYLGEYNQRMKLSGPNGEVNIIPRTSRIYWFESLIQFYTSKTERLEVNQGYLPFGRSVYQALLLMGNLRTLTLFKYKYPTIFINALNSNMGFSEAVVCPKLEELVLVLHADANELDITSVIEMAAARASRGEKLRTIRIVDEQGLAALCVSELSKHVWNVEYSRWVPGF